MGLFDKVFGAQQTRTQEAFSPSEAHAAITLAAIASDGYLADEEIDGFITIPCQGVDLRDVRLILACDKMPELQRLWAIAVEPAADGMRQELAIHSTG